MTEGGLYERYKDALRRGHVAALRGRLDAAVLAYTEAAELAPDRALPHAGLGGVLLRLERPVESLSAYDAALTRAPADEVALAGRAEALTTLGRRVDAAEALDILAGVQESAGRLPEACDTARRALELAESRERRRHVQALAQRLRDVPADDAAAAALERALGMLEPVAPAPAAPEPPGPAATTDAPAAQSGAGTTTTSAAAPDPDATAPTTAKPAEHTAEPEPAAPEAAPTQPEPNAATAPDAAAAPEPEPSESIEHEPEPEPAVDAVRLTEEAADRLEAGETAPARDALVNAAAAHRAAGNVNAALDACYLALEIAPDDAELHLLLARLYVDRGWQRHADEKLRLLDRFTELSGDRPARTEVRQLVAALADAADEAAPPA